MMMMMMVVAAMMTVTMTMMVTRTMMMVMTTMMMTLTMIMTIKLSITMLGTGIPLLGHVVAPVANCCQAEYSSQVKQDMTVKEFCDYWNKKSGGRSP